MFRLNLGEVIQSVELGVHSPEVEFVGRGGEGAHLSDFEGLDGVVFEEAVLDDSEVVQGPTVVRVANVQIHKRLKVYNVVKYWVFLLELCQVLLVLLLDRVLSLILSTFIKIRLDTAVLVCYLLKIVLVCLLKHIIRTPLLKYVLPPSPLYHHCRSPQPQVIPSNQPSPHHCLRFHYFIIDLTVHSERVKPLNVLLNKVELFLFNNMKRIKLCHGQLPSHQQLDLECLNIPLDFCYLIQTRQYYSIMQKVLNHFLNHQSSLDFLSQNCLSHDFCYLLHGFQSFQPPSCLQTSLYVSLNNSDVLDPVLDPSMSDKLSDRPLHILDHLNLFVMSLCQQNRFHVPFNFRNCPSLSLLLFQVYVFHKQRNQFMTFDF